MNNKIFHNLIKNTFGASKKLQGIRSVKPNLFVFSIIFIIVATIVFSYNNSVKKKRLEQIDFFISNDQTVLLKNYLLNQIKSPYLEYDYVVKNKDTVAN